MVILGRSPRPCCTARILAINFSDRLPPPLSELAAASSQLEPRLPRSNTLELRRGRAAPGVPPELRRDESSEACDSVLELRRSRLPCDVAPEAVLKAATAAAATTMASFDTSSMSASICSPVAAGTCVSAQLKVEFTEKKCTHFSISRITNKNYLHFSIVAEKDSVYNYKLLALVRVRVLLSLQWQVHTKIQLSIWSTHKLNSTHIAYGLFKIIFNYRNTKNIKLSIVPCLSEWSRS